MAKANALKKMLWPLLVRFIPSLNSRKARVGIAGILGTLLANWGLNLNAEVTYAIIVISSAIILGIAGEDFGKLVAGTHPTQRREVSESEEDDDTDGLGVQDLGGA